FLNRESVSACRHYIAGREKSRSASAVAGQRRNDRTSFEETDLDVACGRTNGESRTDVRYAVTAGRYSERVCRIVPNVKISLSTKENDPAVCTAAELQCRIRIEFDARPIGQRYDFAPANLRDIGDVIGALKIGMA